MMSSGPAYRATILNAIMVNAGGVNVCHRVFTRKDRIFA